MGYCLEKTAELAAEVHEIAVVPFAYPHINAGVLIKGGYVLFPGRVIVYGKMNQNEIQKHADIHLVVQGTGVKFRIWLLYGEQLVQQQNGKVVL